jgi:hypothetical protein
MRAGGRTDGQTDMAKFTVAFRNFSNSPKKGAFRRQVAPANVSMFTSYNAADIKAVGRHTLLSEATITMYHARNVVFSQMENDKAKIRDSHGGDHKDYCRLGCDAVTFDIHAPTFRRKHIAARY